MAFAQGVGTGACGWAAPLLLARGAHRGKAAVAHSTVGVRAMAAGLVSVYNPSLLRTAAGTG